MPVAIAALTHHGLAVGPLVPPGVTDVKGFLAWAKANPEQASYGSPGAGSTPEEMARSQRAEFERWGPLVKRVGFTAGS